MIASGLLSNLEYKVYDCIVYDCFIAYLESFSRKRCIDVLHLARYNRMGNAVFTIDQLQIALLQLTEDTKERN